MKFWEWLEIGVANRWISGPVCATHDGIPGTEFEAEAWDAGDDPCQHVLRLWPDDSDPATEVVVDGSE